MSHCIFSNFRLPRITSSNVFCGLFSPYVLLQSPYTSLPNNNSNNIPFFQQVQTTLVYPFATLHIHRTHHHVISLQLFQVFFFLCPGLTAIENKTHHTCIMCRQRFPNFLPATSNSSHNAFFNTPSYNNYIT